MADVVEELKSGAINAIIEQTDTAKIPGSIFKNHLLWRAAVEIERLRMTDWREKYVEARTDVNVLKSQVYLLGGDLDRMRTDRNDWRMIAAIGWLWSVGLFGLWWLI